MLGRVTISLFLHSQFFPLFKMDPDYTYQTVPCPATRYGESRFRDENGICVRESELLGRYPDNQDEKSALHQLHGHTTSLLSQLDFYVEDLGMITIAIFYNLLLLFKCCFCLFQANTYWSRPSCSSYCSCYVYHAVLVRGLATHAKNYYY